ncbi:Cell wall protein IFF11 [Candida viswanathii]|uniref:Cell wall protein IFF11 n=1 Tax=Candida viswanathii TaxID=5486 RepID=A0A367XP93_9ASCO|nr:Cell wall protein IFF11 [Candida viswanathii]
MLLKNFIIPFLIAATTVTAFLDISSSLTKFASFDFNVGDISITKGASFTLVDKIDAIFQGGLSIEKDCDLFLVSKVEAIKVKLENIFSTVVNKGLWVIKTVEATKKAIISIAVAKLENIGNLIYYIEAEKLAIISKNIKNTGCIHIKQDACTDTVAELGCNGGSIENQGTICLTNYKAKIFAPVSGSGCIAIEKDSHIEIGDFFSFDKEQTFYLGASKGSICAAPSLIPKTYKVVNFSKEKKISLTTPLGSFSLLKQAAFSYDSNSGVLTLRAGLKSQKFFIGKGYDSSKFSVCKDDNTAVEYDGDCPAPSRPAVCQPCPEAPETPAQ